MSIPTIENDGYSKDININPYDPNEYRTATVYNDDNPIRKVINTVNGTPWTVDYYTQVIDRDSQLSTPDINADITVLQYTKIHNLILYVEDALEPNHTDTEGMAYIHSGITPNVNDVFKATIFGNREVILIITNVDYSTYNNTKLYKVTYKPRYYLDIDISIYHKLEKSIIRTYYYDKGSNAPLLLKEEYDYKKEVIKAIPYLTEMLLDVATTKKSYIHVPDKADITVDPYIEDFIWKIIDTEHYEYRFVNMTKLSAMKEVSTVTTIFDILISKNHKLLDIIDNKVHLVDTSVPYHPVITKSSYMGVVKLIVLSKDGTFVTKDTGKEHTLPINIDSYIFSNNFYNRVGILSDMEQLTLDYLDNKEIDYKDIVNIVEDVNKWGKLDRFYYLPILLLIMQYYTNNKNTYM